MFASPNVSFSFQRLIKLSWQAAHFRLIPRKTCAAFCAACIGGVWLALTTPRQVTPIKKPFGAALRCRIEKLADHLVIRTIFDERVEQPFVMDLRSP